MFRLLEGFLLMVFGLRWLVFGVVFILLCEQTESWAIYGVLCRYLFYTYNGDYLVLEKRKIK